MWFIAFFSDIFNLNNIAVYSIIYVPFFITAIFFGAFAVARVLLMNKAIKFYQLFLLSILFLLIQILTNPLSDTTPFINFFLIGNAIYHIKYAIVYLIFLYAFLLIYQQKYQYSFFVVLMLVALYSTISPAILSGLFVVLIYLRKVKKLNKHSFYFYFFWLFLVAIYYVLFYYFQSNSSNTSAFSVLKFSESFQKIGKISVLLIGVITIFIFGYYFFLRKLSFIQNLTPNIQIYATTFILFMLAAFVGVFLVFPVVNAVSHDAFQLLSNFLTPVYSLVVFVIIIYFIQNKKPIHINGILLLLLGYFGTQFLKNPPFSINLIAFPNQESKIDLDYYTFIKNALTNKPKFAFL